jgi:hypothetical protein
MGNHSGRGHRVAARAARGPSEHGSFIPGQGKRGRPAHTPEQRAAAEVRNRANNRARVDARQQAQRAARLAEMTPEARARFLAQGAAVKAGRARTPDERAQARHDYLLARQNARRQAERLATRTPAEQAVPIPHVKVGRASAAQLGAYRAALGQARSAAERARIRAERAQGPAVATRLAELEHEARTYQTRLARAQNRSALERAYWQRRLDDARAEHSELRAWQAAHPDAGTTPVPATTRGRGTRSGAMATRTRATAVAKPRSTPETRAATRAVNKATAAQSRAEAAFNTQQSRVNAAKADLAAHKADVPWRYESSSEQAHRSLMRRAYTAQLKAERATLRPLRVARREARAATRAAKRDLRAAQRAANPPKARRSRKAKAA